MCIAILNKRKVTLNKSLLQTCWNRNKDGGGLLYAVKGKLHIYKAMGKKMFIKEYFKVRKKFPDTDILLHFRWSTHGKESLDNIHPHIVNSDVAFVHNGVLDNVIDLHLQDVKRYSKKAKSMVTEKRFVSDDSDTALFAKMLNELPKDFMKDEVLVALIKNYIEDDNKLVFMNRAGESVIVNEEAGVWEGGCWFSNYGFLTNAELKKREAEEKAKEEEEIYSGYQAGLYDDDWTILDSRHNRKPSAQGCCVKEDSRELQAEDDFYNTLDSEVWPEYQETLCSYCIAPTYSVWEQQNECCRTCFDSFNGELEEEADEFNIED